MNSKYFDLTLKVGRIFALAGIIGLSLQSTAWSLPPIGGGNPRVPLNENTPPTPPPGRVPIGGNGTPIGNGNQNDTFGNTGLQPPPGGRYRRGQDTPSTPTYSSDENPYATTYKFNPSQINNGADSNRAPANAP